MKKLGVLLFLLMLVGQQAHATKARILALGDDVDGSFHIDDDRNIFLNVANIHNYADSVILEYGDSAGSSTTNLDQNSTPKAAGGFLKRSGQWVYGVYLGNESNTDQLLRMSSWGTANNLPAAVGERLQAVDNYADFFIGSESGKTKWAVNFLYADNENENLSQDDKRYAIRGGILSGKLNALINLSLAQDVEDTSNDNRFDGKLGFQLGLSYDFDEFVPYVTVRSGKWDITEGSGSIVEGKFFDIRAGVGYKKEVSDSSTIFARLNYFRENVEVAYSGGLTEATLSSVPLSIGFESKATEWLTFRGSITHQLIGSREATNLVNVPNVIAQQVYAVRYRGSAASLGNVDESAPDTTDIAAGATLTFGNVALDGFIGATNITGSAEGEVGALSLDRLLTRVGMTYKF